MAHHSGQSRDRNRNKRNNQQGGHQHRHGRTNGANHHRAPTSLLPLDPFTMFGALYLGLTDGDHYRPLQLNDLARRFGVGVAELKDKIHEFGLDRESLKKSGFDLEMAQLDIRVAPEGISRRELAKTWYEELRKVLPETAVAPPAPQPSVSAAVLPTVRTPEPPPATEETMPLFDEDFLDP